MLFRSNSIDRVEYMGIIGSEQEASISFKVSGQLENLPFREGVRVSNCLLYTSTPKKLFEDMDRFVEATRDLKLIL